MAEPRAMLFFTLSYWKSETTLAYRNERVCEGRWVAFRCVLYVFLFFSFFNRFYFREAMFDRATRAENDSL